MKISGIRRAAALLAVLTLVLTMSACYQPPGAVIGNAQNTTTANGDAPIPTRPQKEGQLTLSLLMGVMGSQMKWSDISSYTHTDVDDTHATFAVADNYGKECTLSITYDAASDVVSKATLSYDDVAVDVMCDNTLVIRTIMIAMNKD